MKLIRTYKYRLYPNRTQENLFLLYFGGTRFLYNSGLEHRITAYKTASKSISYYDQANELKAIKKTEGLEWLGEIQSQVLQDTLKRLDKSFKSFFKSGFGFPKFAKRSRWNSFTFPQINNFQIEGKRIKLPKIGFVKFREHRKFEGKAKTITVKRENNHWFICISAEIQPRQFQGESQAVGIDLGVARLATLSTGEFFEPFQADDLQGKLKIKQRKLSRQKRHGQNWKKTVHQIQKIHSKISRKRKDYLHKVSDSITSRFDTIILEDLRLSNMTKSAKGTVEEPGSMVKQKSGLNRSLLNQSLGLLSSQIEYKTIYQSGICVKVNPAYTSQTCSACGFVSSANRKTQALFSCLACGHTENADTNSGKNILASGTDALALTYDIGRSVAKEATCL